MNFLVRVLLMAFLFTFVFPIVSPGVAIHGGFFPQGIVCGLLFAFTGWILGWIFGFFTVATFGLGLLLIWAFRILIPTLQLVLMSSLFPAHLTVVGWGAALVAGLLIFVIDYFTLLKLSKDD